MDTFLKATAGILIAVVLGMSLSKHSKDISVLLSVTVCCMVAFVAAGFMSPILDFIGKLQVLGDLNTEIIETLLKAVGVGILSEVTGMICTDSGNGALAKIIQFLASVVILWLMIPLLTILLESAEEILGAI